MVLRFHDWLKFVHLIHDWKISLKLEKGQLIKFHRREGGYKGYLLNYTILRSICFSSIKSLLFVIDFGWDIIFLSPIILNICWIFVQTKLNRAYTLKRFYNGETNSAAYYAIQWMSFIPPFPSMHFKELILFLIQGFSQSWKKKGI